MARRLYAAEIFGAKVTVRFAVRRGVWSAARNIVADGRQNTAADEEKYK